MAGPATDRAENRIEKWAAINGKWKFTKGVAQYLGPTPEQTSPPVGLARASIRFRDGLICSKVKLTKNKETTAGFFVCF
jgi:hypothetical protein